MKKNIALIIVLSLMMIACGIQENKKNHNEQTKNEDNHNHKDGDNHEDEDNHDHEDGDNHDYEDVDNSKDDDHSGEIILEAAQAKALGLTYQTVDTSSFKAAVKVSGIIEISNANKYNIVANTSGIVEFVHPNINVGSQINKKETLFIITGKNLSQNNPEAKLRVAKIAYEKAKKDYARVKKLLEDNLVTENQMEQSKLNLQEALEVFVNLTKAIAIKSNFKGSIIELNCLNGQFVNEGETLATIQNTKEVTIKADLPVRYFDMMDDIETANFILPYNNQVVSLDELNGRIITIANNIYTNSYSIPIRFNVNNNGDMITGMPIDVFLITKNKPNVIAIPSSSLTEEQGAYYVYIKEGEDTYEKRNVKIGSNNGVDTEIVSGLEPNDIVVTKGAYFVRLASLSTDVPSHAH